MPEGCPPFLPRPPDTRSVCLRGIVVLWLLLAFVASAQAQLTLNRYIQGPNTNIPIGGDNFSTNTWGNNGLTNISSVSVNMNLSSPEGEDFLVEYSEAYLSYNVEAEPASNRVIQGTIYAPGATNGSSLDATFNVTNAFNSPGTTNEWIVSFYNGDDPDQLGSAQFNYWRLIVTGGAVTNGTISVGQQGIISGSDGYTVTATIDAGSGTGTNAVTAFVTNGQSLNFNGGISGSGELAKTGAGALSLGGNSTNFSGTVNLTAGTANLTTTTALGTGTLFQTNGASTAIFSAGGNYTNNMTLANVSFTNSGNTLSGTITNSGSGTFLSAASTTNTISGVMTGAGGLTKDGAGELVIAGSANNTFTGATVVDEGTLVLSNSSGNAINSSTNITVNTGGTLVLGASNQIGDGVGLILSGGTLLVGALNVTESLGTLTLTADSTIDFGNFGADGLRRLTFADSSAISWTGILTITNWQGVANTSSEFTEIFFGEGGLTLTPGQQGQIRFANQGNVAGTLLGTGELVPVPEPPVYAAALAIFAAIGWRERRRVQGWFSRGKPAV
jgi:fibronectin-binding autotransporter adhesin